MRQLVLCGPLVAGCGAATRIDFGGHSRPATPLQISVYVGPGGIQLDPRTITPGPVELNVTNQSAKAVTVVMLSDGRTVSRSPSIPPDGTAQLKATLNRQRFGVGLAGLPVTMKLLRLRGEARTGDDDVAEP